MKVNNRKDILLLLLFAPGVNNEVNDSIVGRTKLVKAIFLFKKEVWKAFKKDIELTDENMYEFFAWNYGPFSKQIYDDINFFLLRNFIEVTSVDGDMILEEAAEWDYWLKSTGSNDEVNEFNEEAISLTELGKKFTSQLYESLEANQKNLLSEFKKRIQTIQLRALLRYVYSNYPEETTKSQIKEQILR